MGVSTKDKVGAPFSVSVPREYEVGVEPGGRVCSLTGDYWEQEEEPAFRWSVWSHRDICIFTERDIHIFTKRDIRMLT